MKYLLAVAGVVALLAAQAVAEDFQPPDWRGIPGSQTVQWEFLQNPGTYPQAPGGLFIAPDCVTQYGWTGAFAPTLFHVPGPGAGWSAVQPTSTYGNGAYNPQGNPGDGWINLSGEVTIHLPDVQVANPTKEIWLQSWEPQSGGDIPSVWYGAGNLTPAATAPYLQFQAGPLVDTIVWGNGLPTQDSGYPFRAVHQTIYHFDLNPNPNDETIYIRGGINVDEIVIDTRCGAPVPEPATLSLLGFGLVPFVWRRFKK